jgi:pimeloyl-ACP methyl ester carboxylesterase
MRPSTEQFDNSCFSTVRGLGPHHLFLLPGLVPDGRETFLRQQSLFRTFGSVTTVNYPYDAFDLDRLIVAVAARIRTAADRGERPVLVGVSVGGGIALEMLRRTQQEQLPLAGIMLVSPLTCADDLAPMLRRYIDPVLNAAAGSDQLEAIEKGRTFFRMLASRSMGEPLRSPWKALLTPPHGWIQLREQAIRERIERTLNGISTNAGIDRVLAIGRFVGVHQVRGALHTAPTLLLWGSRERHTLRMDGPGTGMLCRPDMAHRLFPDAEIQWVYERDGGEVPHASLLKHSAAFNGHFKRHLKRVAKVAARPAAAAAS